jgi:hypothetical protein
MSGSLLGRCSSQTPGWVERDEVLRGDRHSAYASSRSFVPGYLTVKSDELIKKKGAIAFGVYGVENNDRESKLTNPVQRTKGSDRVIAKTLVAADGERYAAQSSVGTTPESFL